MLLLFLFAVELILLRITRGNMAYCDVFHRRGRAVAYLE